MSTYFFPLTTYSSEYDAKECYLKSDGHTPGGRTDAPIALVGDSLFVFGYDDKDFTRLWHHHLGSWSVVPIVDANIHYPPYCYSESETEDLREHLARNVSPSYQTHLEDERYTQHVCPVVFPSSKIWTRSATENEVAVAAFLSRRTHGEERGNNDFCRFYLTTVFSCAKNRYCGDTSKFTTTFSVKMECLEVDVVDDDSKQFAIGCCTKLHLLDKKLSNDLVYTRPIVSFDFSLHFYFIQLEDNHKQLRVFELSPLQGGDILPQSRWKWRYISVPASEQLCTDTALRSSVAEFFHLDCFVFMFRRFIAFMSLVGFVETGPAEILPLNKILLFNVQESRYTTHPLDPDPTHGWPLGHINARLQPTCDDGVLYWPGNFVPENCDCSCEESVSDKFYDPSGFWALNLDKFQWTLFEGPSLNLRVSQYSLAANKTECYVFGGNTQFSTIHPKPTGALQKINLGHFLTKK